jgi:ribosomal protein S18 acetylase RimI-like enzyme
VLIREAAATDLEAIFSFDHIARLEQGRRTSIDGAVRSGSCLVAEQDAAVVGYAVLNYSFYGNGFVPFLYVAQAARRCGIGRALMQSLAGRCATEKLFTSTNDSNVPMRQLLESLGYERSGIIYNLDPGDPELVYLKRLRPGAA